MLWPGSLLPRNSVPPCEFGTQNSFEASPPVVEGGSPKSHWRGPAAFLKSSIHLNERSVCIDGGSYEDGCSCFEQQMDFSADERTISMDLPNLSQGTLLLKTSDGN